MNFVKIDDNIFVSVKSDNKDILLIRNSNSNKGFKKQLKIAQKNFPYIFSLINNFINLNKLTKKEYKHLLSEINEDVHNSVIGMNYLSEILKNKNQIKDEIKKFFSEEECKLFLDFD